MAKILLLISKLDEDRVFAESAAKSAGIPIRAVETAEEGVEIIANEDVGVILADTSTEELYRKLELAIQEKVGLFSDKINANAIHFLSDESIDKSRYLVQSPIFGHFLMRNFTDARDTGDHYGRIIKATLADRAFGLKNLLKAGAKTQVVTLQRTSQKQDAVEAVRSYFLAAKFQNRMATVIANAVDELLMNAMFDAPVDQLGKSLYSGVSRSTNMDLTGQQCVEMHVGYDGQYAAVAAADLFGSLDKVKLLTHISKIYTEEEYKVRTANAGAGIGLATVFRSGGSFFFVSESRVRTEVTVFFKRADSFREFRDQFRFLSTQFYF